MAGRIVLGAASANPLTLNQSPDQSEPIDLDLFATPPELGDLLTISAIGGGVYQIGWVDRATVAPVIDLASPGPIGVVTPAGGAFSSLVSPSLSVAAVAGTDAPGTDLVLSAGASTGAGAPGNFVVRTSGIASSGSAVNAMGVRLSINNASALFNVQLGLASGSYQFYLVPPTGQSGSYQVQTPIANPTDLDLMTIDGTVSPRRISYVSRNAIVLRRVGALMPYLGTDGNSQGWIEEFDGRWVYLTLNSIRTIGNASSGAAIAAAWCQILFEFIWNSFTNERSPVLLSNGSSTSRGANAAADWAANRRITLPDFRGRVVAGAGTGSGLSGRNLHATTGTETHQLTTAELPAHAHGMPIGVSGGTPANPGNNLNAQYTNDSTGATAWTGTVNGAANGNLTGSGNAHNNMQPTIFEHLLISAGAR